jgi:hypothetical protein
MVFIDWISSRDHRSFNESFFKIVGEKNDVCFVFDKKLVINDVDTILINQNKGRLKRFLCVLSLCVKYRAEKLFFVTYDPFFIVFLSLLMLDISVFEHNTTPETTNLSKHSIWQLLFLGRLKRLAQFRGQFEILKKLNQKVFYIGSPLRIIKKTTVKSKSCGNYYLAPSYRMDLDELLRIIPSLDVRKVLVKKAAFDNSENAHINKFRRMIIPKLHITESDINNAKGIIITLQSDIRGTGWFNEAIGRKIPLLLSNKKIISVFIKTFPNYPFIDISHLNEHELRIKPEKLNVNISDQIAYAYILMNNFSFKQNFKSAISS